MHNTYLLIGGNLGNRLNNLNKAILLIEKYIGRIMIRSSVYETAAWGFEPACRTVRAGRSENMFLNRLLCVETSESPRNMLSIILKIETMMGRKRENGKTGKRENGKANYKGDRIIDIDILFYDDIILNEEDLKIPHPYLHLRRFALVPLAEIANNMIHPGLNKTIGQLLEKCTDDLEVEIKSNFGNNEV